MSHRVIIPSVTADDTMPLARITRTACPCELGIHLPAAHSPVVLLLNPA